MAKRSFSAFPNEGVQFLRSLKRHNNREWFQQHKGDYDRFIRQPMADLIACLADDFRKFAPEMVASPKVSVYRIHRDTRFSKDKSPYKTHAAAVFPRSGLDKHEGAGFYLHIAPSETLVGGGLYMPSPEDLNLVRQRIAGGLPEFLKIVRNQRFRNAFGELEGERLSRVPRGFRADHPAAEFLKYKQFLAARTFSTDVSVTPAFYPLVIETFRAILPLVRFINEPIVQMRSARDRQVALLNFAHSNRMSSSS
jgi:uncharacterized protein (TIGR02453 family)